MLVALLLLTAPLVLPAPPVSDIVSRATAVIARGPAHAICQAESEQMRLGKQDMVEMSERAAFVRTFTNGTMTDAPPTQRWKDDQALTAEQVATINGRAASKNGETLDEQLRSPFFQPELHEFTLAREETLWGRAVYVLTVTAKKAKGARGTVWVDAETAVELKGELVPQEMPSNVDSLMWQEQFEKLPDDSVVRSLIHIEGRGHFLFFRAATRFNARVKSCAVQAP